MPHYLGVAAPKEKPPPPPPVPAAAAAADPRVPAPKEKPADMAAAAGTAAERSPEAAAGPVGGDPGRAVAACSGASMAAQSLIAPGDHFELSGGSDRADTSHAPYARPPQCTTGQPNRPPALKATVTCGTAPPLHPHSTIGPVQPPWDKAGGAAGQGCGAREGHTLVGGSIRG